MISDKINIFWFRRDLRLDDNAGLYHALNSGLPVLPVFIFDRNILDRLDTIKDPRVEFIYNSLDEINKKLTRYNSSLAVFCGKPDEIFPAIIKQYQVNAVFANKDYEPYARERDTKISSMLSSYGIKFELFKDQVIFEEDEVLKQDGKPYTVFTPYSISWKRKFKLTNIENYTSEKLICNFLRCNYKFPELGELGFKRSGLTFPSKEIKKNIISKYHIHRDYPFIENGTTRLGIHLRFGTLSIRKLVQLAAKLNETFLNELIWREFFMMILWHFPHTTERSFKQEYDLIRWRNNEKEFFAWCNGLTGYPLVDAGMRELNNTGYMHNRVRMITASFLSKHLLIDWRWGERYFASRLLDFELSSNVGNWQWAAGSGCDAAPYFRIFNPAVQTKKFDPKFKYIKKWVPEFNDKNYPQQIVEHNFARNRAITEYSRALKNNRKGYL
jgi:deoxyribodipyrimidine photo-lyase